MSSNIYEVLELGPLVASNEECGLLVTVNGSYFNLWVAQGDGQYENTDCRCLSAENGLYGLKITEIMERAEAYLSDIIAASDAERE